MPMQAEAELAKGLYVNVGCGSSPTPGWLNFDNSLSVLLGRNQFVMRALGALGAMKSHQRAFGELAYTAGIRWARADRLPLPDLSTSVLYSSHMLEHLSQSQARSFLREAMRVLRPGGVLRLVLPDLRLLVRDYEADGDANRLVSRTMLACEAGDSLATRIRFVIVGARNHQWMYDAKSAFALLDAGGFVGVAVCEPGATRIADPGSLDLRERQEESLYVEAVKPSS